LGITTEVAHPESVTEQHNIRIRPSFVEESAPQRRLHTQNSQEIGADHRGGEYRGLTVFGERHLSARRTADCCKALNQMVILPKLQVIAVNHDRTGIKRELLWDIGNQK
jgi:hypothetical protein